MAKVSEKEKPICPECGKKYATNGSLKRHLCEVHSIGDKNFFKCDHCESIFKRKDYLKILTGSRV